MTAISGDECPLHHSATVSLPGTKTLLFEVVATWVCVEDRMITSTAPRACAISTRQESGFG